MDRAPRLLAATLLATVAVFPAVPARAAASAASGDAWAVLTGVRKSLAEAGATGAAFTQTYVPAGFSSGEKESGRLAMSLPDCLRWDYTEPYAKSFLLCGGVVNSWNPEDKTGRRYRIDRRKEPGLDLLLLGVDELKGRYGATLATGAGGRLEVSLKPIGKVEELTDAVLAVDPKSQRLVEVSYHDRQGNQTRFEIGDYKPLPQKGQFSAPEGIKWEEP